MTAIITSFARAAEKYQGFIIDLWGVVHDGRQAFPPSVEAMARMRALGKKVCLLSNAPSRTDFLRRHLDKLGVKEYDFLLSSGELVWREFKTRSSPQFASLGQKCHIIGAAAGLALLEGLDLIACPDLEEADFVWCVQMPDQDYRPILEKMKKLDLPMVCGNPDMVVLYGDKMALCPGTMAAGYQKMGGRVIYRGKPYPEAYEACFALCASRNLAAIGDGMVTDIAGARRAGLDAYFITGGIHRDELALNGRPAHDQSRLAEFLAQYPYVPTAAMTALVW
ncbi:MAG: TIGR01459 family HAD-type hydrolase [Desulfarculales bacterium]|jgi:HAD superfamily hydrolase (TIGR01459 family)|nr:TIGR01459 family HAD-type hydrolase [Desulfarculales bacterium]